MLYYCHWPRAEVHHQVVWTRELSHQIRSAYDHLLFHSEHQRPSSPCNIQSINSVKPLQPKNVVHLVGPWQMARRHASRRFIFRRIQTCNVLKTNSPEMYCNIFLRGGTVSLRFTMTSIVSRCSRVVQWLHFYLKHWLLRNITLTFYGLVAWLFSFLTQQRKIKFIKQ